MKWTKHVPIPDMSAVADDIPAQVIIPFHRTWGSSHQRIALAGRLEKDMRRLSASQGWEAPCRPIKIDLPSFE
jgi:hypothetical protein